MYPTGAENMPLTQPDLHAELAAHHKVWARTGRLRIDHDIIDANRFGSTAYANVKPAIPWNWTPLAVEIKRARKRPASFTLLAPVDGELSRQRARWFKAPKPLSEMTPKQIKAALGKEAKRIADKPVDAALNLDLQRAEYAKLAAWQETVMLDTIKAEVENEEAA
jgi:hypothetical protein